MVKSVEQILRNEFETSLSDEGVHIIDPFVGTGNFIVRIMREIRKTALPDKYTCELHCNEVMLLPYYVASMNIEHEFYQATGSYQPFEGICLVDTFDLVEMKSRDQLLLFTPENTKRVENKKRRRCLWLSVIHPTTPVRSMKTTTTRIENMKRWINGLRRTFARDSRATLKTKLSDPYVKAIRWASDRIGEQGIVAFVTNNSFLDDSLF